MSLELLVQRFDAKQSGASKHPYVLGELMQTARTAMSEKAQGDVWLASDGKTLMIDLPGGTAELHSHAGCFPICDLDPLTLEMIFRIARAGAMAIIVDGGPHQIILTSEEQRHSLPSELKAIGESFPVCRSSQELKELLNEWHTAHMRYRAYVVAEGPSHAEPDWIPGTRIDGPASFVYLEARNKEGAEAHQALVYKYVRYIARTEGVHKPTSGIIMAEYWRLVTPEGRMFYAYRYGGDKTNYLAMLRDFAASEKRLIGQIVNYSSFVQADGKVFPLSGCNCARAES